jgi:hypothetical protein
VQNGAEAPTTLGPADLTGDEVIKLSFGRKKHALLKPA